MKMLFLFIVISLISCTPTSIEECRYESENISRSLLKDLEKVESLNDLIIRKSKLTKKFAILVDVIIISKKYGSNHQFDEIENKEDQYLSDLILEQFVRIYKIDGCKELMEDIQRESLHKLE